MQPPTFDACEHIDCVSTYITHFYIEYVVFYHGMFTLGRGVTARICIFLIELPLRTMMGGVPALKYMLSSALGFCGRASSLLGNECSCP
jgi:hypothetical protein